MNDIDKHTLLNELHRETSFFNEYLVYENSLNILEELKMWSKKESRSKKGLTKEDKEKLFKKWVNYLSEKMLDRYVYLLKQNQNSERKAIYWKMKYESVKMQEELNEKLMNNVHRLLKDG